MIPNLEKFGYETQTWARRCVWSRHGKRPALRASRRTSFASGPAGARSFPPTFPRRAKVRRPGILGKRFCCFGSPSRCATASTSNCKPIARFLPVCTRVCEPRPSCLSGVSRSPSIPINAGRGLTMRISAWLPAMRSSFVYRPISTRSRRISPCPDLRECRVNSISSRHGPLPDRHRLPPFPPRIGRKQRKSAGGRREQPSI